ncbi:MAG: DUF3168 domain-containing protein [Hyphomicrobiaceae bacterium]|nr:DUF3168 domain-containing protein [Hyphomicrobiaceae bacterium]
MASATWALQKAIYAALLADGTVMALLGGPRIYDDVPPRSEFPYVTLGQSLVRDWSTGTDEGLEHILTLHVWSRADGRREVQELLASVRTALHDEPLAVEGHRLVNLRLELSEVRREPDGETCHGLLRFRAVTEAQ